MPSQVPQDMVLQLCGSYSAAELSPPGPALAELRQAQAAGVSLSLYMEESIQELLHNAAERFKGWMSMPGPQHTELACKKVRTLLPRLAMGPGGGRAQAVCKDPQGRGCPASHCASAWRMENGRQQSKHRKEVRIKRDQGSVLGSTCWHYLPEGLLQTGLLLEPHSHPSLHHSHAKLLTFPPLCFLLLLFFCQDGPAPSIIFPQPFSAPI